MHIDITDNLKKCLARQPRKSTKTYMQSHDCNTVLTRVPPPHVVLHDSSTKTKTVKMAVSISTATPTSVTDQTTLTDNATSASNETKPKPPPPERMINLQVELHDNEELNISHISISAVAKKSTNEVNQR